MAERNGAYCPFCGDRYASVVHLNNGVETSAFVACSTCQSHGPLVIFGDGVEINDDAVIDLWNTRVSITRKKLKS